MVNGRITRLLIGTFMVLALLAVVFMATGVGQDWSSSVEAGKPAKVDKPAKDKGGQGLRWSGAD